MEQENATSWNERAYNEGAQLRTWNSMIRSRNLPKDVFVFARDRVWHSRTPPKNTKQHATCPTVQVCTCKQLKRLQRSTRQHSSNFAAVPKKVSRRVVSAKLGSSGGGSRSCVHGGLRDGSNQGSSGGSRSHVSQAEDLRVVSPARDGGAVAALVCCACCIWTN